MDERDVLLAKVVMDIHRNKTHSEFVFVPLFSVHQIHPINRDNSLLETEKRIHVLQAEKTDILKIQKLSKDELAQYLPSVSAIKAVRENTTSYIAYEGNGRLVALQTVFCPEDNIHIEIEEYCFTNPIRIIQRMNKVKQLHDFIAEDSGQ
ncbi:MAG: hypothetical protein GY705_11260 [Bacteroidetes bacterium]|nr:hypothetical protein [Bacteroidota bacterium]